MSAAENSGKMEVGVQDIFILKIKYEPFRGVISKNR